MLGRPTLYSSDMVSRVYEYLDSCEDTTESFVTGESKKGFTTFGEKVTVKLPSIEGLCFFLKIHKDTVYEWEKKYEDFSDVINLLRAKQADRLINKGLSGDYNAYIAKALLAKHGYADKQEIDQKTTIQDERIDASKLNDEELRTLAEIQRKSRISEEKL